MSISGFALVFALLHSSQPRQAPPATSLCGTVEDQTNAAVVDASVELTKAEHRLKARSDSAGAFCLAEAAPGEYELEIESAGFEADREKIVLRAGETERVSIHLALQTVTQQITVAEGSADTASINVSQTKIGTGLIHNLPSESVNSALSSILTLATPGVAADSNGVFHPLGEHAETSFSIDGQPISDQQSRIFSNQISASTIEEMRTIQGAPPAEFGDKTSLIVEATTRSGLGAGKIHGRLDAGYGSFRTPTTGVSLSSGTQEFGNFFAIDAADSHRFLDAPEFVPLHAAGNTEDFFDRFDWHASDATSLHLNTSAAHSWFQVPNTYDQENAGQDQRQHMDSFNFGIGASHVVSSSLLLTANAWIRQDRVEYYPSSNLFSDQPATLSQSRRLTSTGFRSDGTYSRSRHTIKAGVQLQVTPIEEAFSTGLTDPAFNSPCLASDGTPVANAALTSTAQCAAVGYAVNSSFQPALLQYDLTRGGSLFQFHGAATIREESAYAQDAVQFGRLSLNLGTRFDNYDGISTGRGFQPRAGVAYQIRSTETVLHFSYARVFLTPYNENLVLSSSTGAGGLANGSLGNASVQPLTPAHRNQFNMGIDQSIGRRLNIEGEYFWKYTKGAYDFNTILNTPLNFPVQFRESKIDGALVRLTLKSMRGFSMFSVFGHSRSRLFSPEIGGINFGTEYAPVARPDHDQAFEQTTNLQYDFAEKRLKGLWAGLTWRFDSGLVVVSVPDYATVLTLTADEQQEIGLYCGSAVATLAAPLRSCNAVDYGARLIHIVPPGTYNPDKNPSRIAARNLFDAAFGGDNLWKKDGLSLGWKLTIVNVANKVALYNFLSSFSGTHFVAPRTVEAEVSVHF